MARRWRFSIRSLLIVFVLVAVVASVCGYRRRRIAMVNDCIEAAESVGVELEVVWWPEQKLVRFMQPSTAETISRKCGFPRILSVSALYPSEYTRWYEKLIDCGGAQYVELVGSDFGREHIDALSRLDTAREMKFCTENPAGNIGTGLGQMQNLESLEFRAAGGVSPQTIRSISQLPSLRYLEIDVNSEAVRRFQGFRSSQFMEGMSLRLVDAPQPYAWSVLSVFPQLERFELEGISTDANIKQLVLGAVGLRELTIDLKGASAEGCRLLARLPRLTKLQISHLPCDTGALEGVSALRVLAIRSSTITAAGMKKLSGCPIETLNLSSTQVEGELVEGIGSWEHLTTMELIETNVGEAQAGNLRKSRQWEKLTILP